MNLRCIALLSCLFFETFSQSNLNSRCTIRGSNASGVCKLITNCPEAPKRGVALTTCGFSGRTPIVCCEEKKKVTGNGNVFLDNNKYNGAFIFPDSNEYVSSQSQSNELEAKAEEKCREYSQSVMGVVNAAPLITDPEAVVSIDVSNCDNSGLALVVGGRPAAPGEFPFMAALGYNVEDDSPWKCGGTLISDYYVITAAHCVNTRYGEPVKVRMGEIDLKNDNDGTEYVDYDVDLVKIHEQYKPNLNYHDIALVKLLRKVEVTKFIRPACLWTKYNIDSNVSTATGWGQTAYVGDQSDKLLKVTLDIFDNSVCTKSYPNYSKLPNGIVSSMLCAGKLEGGKDTCQGDSGGPLIVTNSQNRCVSYIVGITSFGKGCGAANLPAVYTRVSNYLPWIAKHIW